MNILPAEITSDMSYCCSSGESYQVSTAIRNWIAARQGDGWEVDFAIRQDTNTGQMGVMWQCIKNRDGIYREFSPCISMNGREFSMN